MTDIIVNLPNMPNIHPQYQGLQPAIPFVRNCNFDNSDASETADTKVNCRNGRRVRGPRPPSILPTSQPDPNHIRTKINNSKPRKLLNRFNNYNRHWITIGHSLLALLDRWYQPSIESRQGKSPGRVNRSNSMHSLNERPMRSYNRPNSATKKDSVLSNKRTSGCG